MGAPNFELISELQLVTRRDFPAADVTLLNPNNANPILEGEWLELDTNYKLARGTGNGKPCVYPVHTERGRYDTQSIGKLNVLMLHDYEAETKIFDSTGLAVGDRLMVGDVTISGQTKRGLKKATGAATTVEVGIVTKLPTGKVRFQRIPPFVRT